MSREYDLEDLLFDIAEQVRTHFNTYIQAVFDEKADGIKIRKIHKDAYAIQTMDDKVLNFDDFVMVELIDPETVGLGPATSYSLNILVSVISCQIGEDNMTRHMFRYGKALKKMFETLWRSNRNGVKLVVKQLPPADLPLMNSSKAYKSASVVLMGDMA